MRPGPPLRAGQFLYRAGDLGDSAWIVRSGMFATRSADTRGRGDWTGFWLPGELIGAEALSGAPYREGAVALDAATVCPVRRGRLERLWSIGAGPALIALLAEAAERATTSADLVRATRADARLAGFLLDLSDRLQRLGWLPNRIPVPMPRAAIADHLGMTPESLSRSLTRLARAGVIRTSRRDIALLRPAALRVLLEQHPHGEHIAGHAMDDGVRRGPEQQSEPMPAVRADHDQIGADASGQFPDIVCG
jgi:CRP/FNR family transcriptional regulator